MAKHRGIWPVAIMYGALGVSRSGFYAWLVRPPSRRRRNNEVMGAHVRQSFIGSDRTYGARRVWHDVLALGLQCGLHRIERLMRDQALRARPRRRDCRRTREREVPTPTTCWTASFRPRHPTRNGRPTSPYIWTAEGWLYVAVALDFYARCIVGWSMQESMPSQLMADALMMAVWRRGRPLELLHHSDRGVSTPANTSRACSGRTTSCAQ